MAGIDVNMAGVIALYDACTGFPVRSSSIRLFTDGSKEPLYKGGGVYVLINIPDKSIRITAEVKGYRTFKDTFVLEKTNGQLPQKIIWMVPDKDYKGYRIYTRLRIHTVSSIGYVLFIKCREEQLKLSKEKQAESDELHLFGNNDVCYEGRSILITDKSNNEYVRRVEKLIDETACRYRLDKTFPDEAVYEKVFIYKGYDVVPDENGFVEMVVPYIVREDTELVLYKNNGEKITEKEVDSFVYK